MDFQIVYYISHHIHVYIYIFFTYSILYVQVYNWKIQAVAYTERYHMVYRRKEENRGSYSCPRGTLNFANK